MRSIALVKALKLLLVLFIAATSSLFTTKMLFLLLCFGSSNKKPNCFTSPKISVNRAIIESLFSAGFFCKIASFRFCY